MGVAARQFFNDKGYVVMEVIEADPDGGFEAYSLQMAEKYVAARRAGTKGLPDDSAAVAAVLERAEAKAVADKNAAVVERVRHLQSQLKENQGGQ